MAKLPPWLLVLLLGCVLLLPMLGSFGLWDPQEISRADVAQEVAKSGNVFDTTLGGKFQRKPVLTTWLTALGFKLFGVNELAGRLPLALCGILALLVVYRVARRLVGQRAALLSAFVLGTTPTFIFQSRQLVSEVGFITAVVAGVGGLAAFIWPVDGRRSRLDLVLAVVGLVGGFLAQGLVVGTLFPLLALALAVALSWNTPNRGDANQAFPAADGPHLQPGTTVGQAVRSSAIHLITALAASGVIIVVLMAVMKDSKFMVLGAAVRKVAVPPTFETTFKDLGWSFFPWFAVLPIAFAWFMLAQRSRPHRRSRVAFTEMLVLVLGVGGYILASLWVGYVTRIHYPTLPWLALGIGVLIHHVWHQAKPVHRLWGVVAAGLILVIQQDYFMSPSSLAFSHLLTSAKYPIDLSLKLPARLFGILLAVGFFLALGGTPRRIGIPELPKLRTGIKARLYRLLVVLVRPVARLLDFAGAGFRTLTGDRGQRAAVATALVVLVFAGWCSFWLMPQLSLHMSNKALFQVFHDCRTGGEKLAQYQVPGRGAAYYNNGQVEEVGSQSQLFQLLRRPERWFILVPTNYLASIDQAARRAKLPYYVLDDRSSKYLLISNRLEGRCKRDKNPLRRYVVTQPPTPKHKLVANFENKVKLIGYDVDPVVTRGGKFPITLYFHVLSQMPSGFKIFLHFDQPASRFHGDHTPLGGKYPTQYWLPGDYIVDPHNVEIPLITTPAGRYTIYMGFWLGSRRLKVTEGPQDGVNRVRLGTIRVR